jgi:ABC-type lipoprotein export system ATPase subunit
MSVVLKTNNLKKSYRDGEITVDVIHDVNLELNKGDFVSIQGASGAGKSTLLNILGAILLPDSGSVTVNGKSLAEYEKEGKLHEYRKQHVGFVFQNHYLLPDFTAVENVMMSLLIRGEKRNVARERSVETLENVGLKDRANHYPSQLSGGESQRVAVARAVVHKPDIILADEPTGNLDSNNRQNFIRILKDLQTLHHLTILVVTHEAELADVASRKYFMKDGILSVI